MENRVLQNFCELRAHNDNIADQLLFRSFDLAFFASKKMTKVIEMKPFLVCGMQSLNFYETSIFNAVQTIRDDT